MVLVFANFLARKGVEKSAEQSIHDFSRIEKLAKK